MTVQIWIRLKRFNLSQKCLHFQFEKIRIKIRVLNNFDLNKAKVNFLLFQMRMRKDILQYSRLDLFYCKAARQHNELKFDKIFQNDQIYLTKLWFWLELGMVTTVSNP